MCLAYGEQFQLSLQKMLHTPEDASKGCAEYVNSTLACIHPIHCTRQRKVKVELDMTTIPAFLVVRVILWVISRPRRPNPKINCGIYWSCLGSNLTLCFQRGIPLHQVGLESIDHFSNVFPMYS